MFNSDFSELPTIYYAELFDHPGTQLNATQRTDSLLRTLTGHCVLGQYAGVRANAACNNVEKIFFPKAHKSVLKNTRRVACAVSEQCISGTATSGSNNGGRT